MRSVSQVSCYQPAHHAVSNDVMYTMRVSQMHPTSGCVRPFNQVAGPKFNIQPPLQAASLFLEMHARFWTGDHRVHRLSRANYNDSRIVEVMHASSVKLCAMCAVLMTSVSECFQIDYLVFLLTPDR